MTHPEPPLTSWSGEETIVVDETPLRIVTVTQDSRVSTRKDLWQTFMNEGQAHLEHVATVVEALVGSVLRQLLPTKTTPAVEPLKRCDEHADENPLPIRTVIIDPPPMNE